MQLKESVVRLPDEDEEEKLYQEALIFALGKHNIQSVPICITTCRLSYKCYNL
jgi:hypothetical protein